MEAVVIQQQSKHSGLRPMDKEQCTNHSWHMQILVVGQNIMGPRFNRILACVHICDNNSGNSNRSDVRGCGCGKEEEIPMCEVPSLHQKESSNLSKNENSRPREFYKK